MPRLSRWGILFLSSTLFIALSGCEATPVRIAHSEGGGPLSATSARGGFAMARPPRSNGTWYGSFGSYLLCSSQSGVAIRLERVGWRSAKDAPPRMVEPWIRVVDGSTPRTTPVSSVLGHPWNPATVRKYPGHYSDKISGRMITQPCSEMTGTEVLREFTELFFVN